MASLGLFESVSSVKAQFLPAVAEGTGLFVGISLSTFVDTMAQKGVAMLPDAVPDTVKGALTKYAASIAPAAVGLFVMPMIERKVSNMYLSRGLRGARMGMIAYSIGQLVGPYINKALNAATLPSAALGGYAGPGLGVDHYLNGAPVTVDRIPRLGGAPMSVDRLNGAPMTVSPLNPIGRMAATLGA